jgi:peptidoglycan hydrolase-like protein with peptidoglycan-binding domain
VKTSTSPNKPVQAASAHTTETKHSTVGHTATRHAVTHRRGLAQTSKTSRGKKGGKQVAKKRGQQAIDSDRAREIQTALIREHYMDGEPSGSWDEATQAAMQRYQADQGWQAKTTPDARALIKLGLGPSHEHLLNPESAMTTPAAPASGDPKAAKPPQDIIPQR